MKNYVTKKCVLSFAIFTLISSQALAVTSPQSAYKSEYRLSDKQSQQQGMKIVEYFSKNYPYNKQQIETYLHSALKEFVLQDFPERTKTHFIWQVSNKKSLGEEVYLSRQIDKQNLNIKLRKPICYNETFIEVLRKQHYTGLVYPPIGMFAKIMDTDKNTGTVSLLYKMNDIEHTICITGVDFDTEHRFDIKDYEGFTVVTPDMPLP